MIRVAILVILSIAAFTSIFHLIGGPAALAGAVAISGLALAFALSVAAPGSFPFLSQKTAALSECPPTAVRNWSGTALTVGSMLCALLLFFQIRIPLQGSELTGNVADAVALMALAVSPYFLRTHRDALSLPQYFTTGLIAITLLFAVSLVYGALTFGWTTWALLNRGVGWLVILGYIIVGLALGMRNNERCRDTVLTAFIATGVIIAALQIILLAASLLGASLPRQVFAMPLQGYASNPNAFAVQMVMTATTAVMVRQLGFFETRKYVLPCILSVLALAVYYSHSRSGMVMFAIILLLLPVFSGRMSWREIAMAIVSPLASIAIVSSLYDGIYAWLNVEDSFVTLLLSVNVVRVSGDQERWASIMDGLQMWLQQPIFGHGLGAYMHHHLETTGQPLVIHSVPAWLLAETGIIGVAVVGAFFVSIVYRIFQRKHLPGGSHAISLLPLLASFGAGCLVHDLFFQRSFWFLLGIFVILVVPSRTNRAT